MKHSSIDASRCQDLNRPTLRIGRAILGHTGSRQPTAAKYAVLVCHTKTAHLHVVTFGRGSAKFGRLGRIRGVHCVI